MNEPRPSHAELREQAGALRLHGLQAHWAEVMGDPQQAHWVAQMLSWEAAERGRRSLERRLRAAHIGPGGELGDESARHARREQRFAGCDDTNALDELLGIGVFE